jgi:pimeloyl-ACP methyl ester carboxylesterase
VLSRGRHPLITVTLVTLGGLVAAACASDGDEGAAGPSTTTEPSAVSTTVDLPEAAIEARQCDPDTVDDLGDGVVAECHWLVVPANRTVGGEATYRLAVTVLRSPNPAAAPDPLVYLSGGPGYAGGSPRYWSTTPFIDERDVIVYDQRGTGASDPDLQCPETEQAVLDGFAAPASYDDEAAAVRTAIGECRSRLEADGVDLTAFSTLENAADLADLRVALGYEEWNLLGVSYGSRLAQEAMRSYPTGIRSVILDSTYPMDRNSPGGIVAGAQRAFDQLAAGCAADADCAATHGDIEEVFDGVVEQYDADPYTSTIDLGPDNGGVVDIAITGADIVAGLFNAMYDTELIPALPFFGTRLAGGDGSLIDQVAIEGIPFINTVSEGMALSTNCADASPQLDDLLAEDADLLADPGRWSSVVSVLSLDLCREWTYAELDPSILDPVTSDIPTLVLSGTYDPITPTPGAEAVAEALANVQFVTFDGTGHGVWSQTDCAAGIAESFLAAPGPVEAGCAAEVPPPDFL